MSKFHSETSESLSKESFVWSFRTIQPQRLNISGGGGPGEGRGGLFVGAAGMIICIACAGRATGVLWNYGCLGAVSSPGRRQEEVLGLISTSKQDFI